MTETDEGDEMRQRKREKGVTGVERERGVWGEEMTVGRA